MELARSTHRYRSRRPEQDAALQVRLQGLAAKRMRFGYRRLSAFRGNRYAWISGLKIFFHWWNLAYCSAFYRLLLRSDCSSDATFTAPHNTPKPHLFVEDTLDEGTLEPL